MVFWIVGAALAGEHVDASRAALERWLGPGQPAEALEEARAEARLATRSPAESGDPATWLHAAQVAALACGAGEGDPAAVEELVADARKAVELGAPATRAAQELQKASLKLTRLSVNATLDSRRGEGTVARDRAYAFARKADEVDRAAEDLGVSVAAQRASTLAVLAAAAVDVGEMEAGVGHYEAMRALGHEDAGLARALVTWKAKTDLDEALAWLQVDLARGENLDLVELQADLLLSADRADDALASVHPHMAVFGGEPGAWALLARTQERSGDVASARESLDRCLTLAPLDVQCLWGRGRVPFREGQSTTVIEVEGRKRQRDEGAAERRRLFKEAVPFLEKARTVDPNHIDVNAALLAIYTELGDRAGLEALER